MDDVIREDPTRKGRLYLSQTEVGLAEIERFAQAIVNGKNNREAWREAKPRSKCTDISANELGWRMSRRKDVQEKIAELRRDMASRHAAFRDQLIEMHQHEIEECYNKTHSLIPVMDVVRSLARIAGFENQTININSRVGALDADVIKDKLSFLAERAKSGGRKD